MRIKNFKFSCGSMPLDYSLKPEPSHVQQPLPLSKMITAGETTQWEERPREYLTVCTTYDKGVPWPGQMQFHQFYFIVFEC